MAVGTIIRGPGGRRHAARFLVVPISRALRTNRAVGFARLWAGQLHQHALEPAGLEKDFPAYAHYITTPKFLASHLAASMLGTGIGLLGFTALFVYLVSRGRPRVSLAAFVTTILGNMGLVALFGVAAFAQRAIGKASLAGHHEVIKSLNSAVYGTPLEVTSGVGLDCFLPA